MQPDAETFAAMIVSTVKAAQAGLVARVAVLEEQLKAVAAAERKTVTVPGERGLAGEKGDPGADGIGEPGPQGKEGAGIASLVISSEGRLVAHLTDGRSVDAGPIPVKEGAPGRDADLADMAAQKTEIVALRAELATAVAKVQVDLPAMMATLKAMVVAEVASLPPARNGTDADLDTVKGFIEEQIAAIPPPRDGKDADHAVIAEFVRTEIHSAVAALPVAKDGQDGTSVTVEDLLPVVSAMVAKSVAEIPLPKDGTPGDQGAPGADGKSLGVEDVAPLVEAEVQKAVAAIPRPVDGAPGAKGIDGTSVSVDDVAPLIQAEVHKAVEALPPAKDGAPGMSVFPSDVQPFIREEIAKAVAAIPVPKDGAPGDRGTDGTSLAVEDVAPLIAAEVQKAVSAIPIPKDGVGLLGALIDREGHLVITLSDGTVKELGAVVGRDVDMADVARLIITEVAKIPAPANGKDGRDGFGFDDIDLVSDERGVFLRFVRGEVTKEFRLPVVVDKGIFSEGKTYHKGEGVTRDGSFWIAQDETSATPGLGATPWRLAVKRGGEGKQGKPGKDGKDGIGRDGKDLTQYDSSTGRKW